MAILFSKATLYSGEKQSSFLIAGIPSDADSFIGWNAFHAFVDSLTPASLVKVEVTSYTYGEQEVVTATPEEVAYMAMRMKMRPDFLETRCTVKCQLQFEFSA